MKGRREEEIKVNKKIVYIYAFQEHAYRNERNKLQHEINLLRKDLLKNEIGGFFSSRSSKAPIRVYRCCEKCKVKANHLKKLKKTLNEKEFS
jgi:hypothetical protein